MGKKRKKRSSGPRRAMKTLCTVLGVILVVMLGLTAYAQHLLGRINYVKDQDKMSAQEVEEYLATQEADPNATGETLLDEELDWGTGSDTLIGKSDNIVNILLVGQDARPGEGRSRSDVMILCTYNKQTQTLTMTSFLRDLYVQIPGYGNSKLNHTYVWGGMDLLNETLEKNFGIYVDGNLEVNFERFSQLIELLGGVEMELRQDEANYINREVGGSLSAGMQHLNGQQALTYARIRSLDADADFSRTNRQRKLLTSLIDEFKDSSLTTVLGLLNEALPMLSTNMTQSEIVSYVTELFPLLSGTTVVSQRIPADGEYTTPSVNGVSVVKADMDAARQLLEDTLGTE